MANKNAKPPTHSQFKPGQSGNPAGKPKAVLTKADVEIIFQKFAKKNKEELQSVVLNPKSTMLEIMVAAVMVKAAKDGDANRLEFLLSRAVGKVKDQVELSGDDDRPIMLTAESQAERMMRIKNKIEKLKLLDE